MQRIIALILCAILALPTVGAPSVAAAAPRYFAFCPGGVPSLGELARRMDASIAADGSGHQKLEKCHANPVQFLAAFQKADPMDGPKTLADLPRYVREDLERTTIDTHVKWMSSCIRGKSPDADDVIMECQADRIGEKVEVYRNKKSHRLVLKLDCANPGLAPAAPAPCAYVRFHVGERYTQAGVPIWGDGTDDVCWGWRKLGPNGETPQAGDWHDMGVGCETRICNYRRADALVAPRIRTFVGEIDDLTPGWYEIRVAKRFAKDDADRIGICLKSVGPHGRVVSSLNPIVRPEDYEADHGTLVAKIYEHQSDLPQGVVRDAPGDLFFDER